MKILKLLLSISLFFISFFAGFSQEISAQSIPVEKAFSDISTDFIYYEELQILYDRGMIFPDINGKFNPEKLLNRDEFTGIMVEIGCQRCISPHTDFELIKNFENTGTFYDVSKVNRFYYCIAESESEGYLKGYNAGYTCEDGTAQQDMRPFCVDNKITLEEALALILRSSGIFTIQDNQSVIRAIYNGEIKQDLSTDVSPTNSDGSPYTFYGYFERALDFQLLEYDANGEQRIYDLLELQDGKLNPKELISKEDFVRIAYIALKSSTCVQQAESDLVVDIEILDPSCNTNATDCEVADLIDESNRVFDFKAESFGECNGGEAADEEYTWRFYNLNLQKDYIKYGKYIDNYEFLESGTWRISLEVINSCGSKGTTFFTLNIKDLNEPTDSEYDPLGAQIFSSPDAGTTDTMFRFRSNITGGDGNYTYLWSFGDYTTSTLKNASHRFSEEGKYRVSLKVKDGSGEEVIVYITTLIKKSGDGEEGGEMGLSIEASPNGGKTPLEVKFTSTISGGTAPYTYSWEFKTGESSTQASPTHIFNQKGNYEVTLMVEDSVGKTAEGVVTVGVGELAERLSVGIIPTPLKGTMQTTFNFKSEVSGGNGSYTYKWTLTDGTEKITQNVEHQFQEAGSYEVTLEVNDRSGMKERAQVIVVVEEGGTGEEGGEMGLSIEASPNGGKTPLEVKFTSTISGGTAPYTYSWEFKTGESSTQASPTHIFNQKGNYEVTLMVEDSVGKTAEGVVTVGVGELAERLSVGIIPTPLKGTMQTTFNFKSEVSGGNGSYTYKWTLTDGTEKITQNVEHQFQEAGSYEVTLEVNDRSGMKERAQVIVVVEEGGTGEEGGEMGLSIEASPNGGKTPLEVKFTSTISGGTAPYTYSWEFKTGESSTQASPTHIFNQKGNYEVTLMVEDSVGKTAEGVVTVGVGELAERLSVGIIPTPLKGTMQTTFNFKSEVSGGNGSYTYKWTLTDGTEKITQNVEHQFQEAGSYEVTLEVNDRSGMKERAQVIVVVEEGGTGEEGGEMGLSIEASPNGGKTPLEVKFTSTISGGTAPYTYSWEFKTGESSTQASPTYIYRQSGSYTVVLTVTDAVGQEAEASVALGVSQGPILTSSLTVTAEADPRIGNKKLQVSFTGAAVSDTQVTYSWDFRDGTVGVGETISHTFFEPGLYNVQLGVIDEDGNTGNTEVSIMVLDGDSCLLDEDEDGIMDCDDDCPAVVGDALNDGCPIFEEKCRSGCNCEEGYQCSSNDTRTCETDGICVVARNTYNGCLENGNDAVIIGNSICLTCPCEYTLEFDSQLRKCDFIFPAITSPDSSRMFSKGDMYRIDGGEF